MGLNKRDKVEKGGRAGGEAQKVEMQAANEAESAAQGEDKTRRTCLHKQLRKTKFCMYHLQGVCQFGDSCAFAHSCGELQGAPDLRKTRICKAFTNGVCKDPECSFAHTEEELRSTDMFYKKTLCMWHEKGRCRNGDQCRFAHGFTELRTREQNEKALAEKGGKGAPPATQGSRGQRIPKTMAAARPEVEALSHGQMGKNTRVDAVGHNGAAPTMPCVLKGAPGLAPQGPNLEPMFVVQPSLPSPPASAIQAPPGVGPPRGANRNPILEQLTQCSSQLEQLSRLSSAMTATNGAQVDSLMGMGQTNAQLQQLKLAATAAAAASHGEKADSTELEKLSQNIANLSMQLSRFEMLQMAGKRTVEPDMKYALGSLNPPMPTLNGLYPMSPLMAEAGYPQLGDYGWGAMQA